MGLGGSPIRLLDDGGERRNGAWLHGTISRGIGIHATGPMVKNSS